MEKNLNDQNFRYQLSVLNKLKMNEEVLKKIENFEFDYDSEESIKIIQKEVEKYLHNKKEEDLQNIKKTIKIIK